LKKRADEIYKNGVYADFEKEKYREILKEHEFERKEWGGLLSENSGKGKFDPWKPKTYRNATQKQLIIDGRLIFRFGSGENWTITRKPVTEEDFTLWIRTNIKKQKFQTPEDRQRYYRDYIKWYYESNDTSTNMYGGFKFTGGMMELSVGLPDEERAKIGRIFTTLLETDPRAYRFQQELFDQRIAVDPMFFAKTALAASFQVEQDLIEDYYHETDEFETKEAVYEFFSKSKYLAKYPTLKEKIIKDAIRKINRYHPA
jgi:hypothetical protein